MPQSSIRIIKVFFLCLWAFNFKGNQWLIFLHKVSRYCIIKWYYSVTPSKKRDVCIWKHPVLKGQQFLNSLTSALVKAIYSVMFSSKYMHFYNRESDILLPIVMVSVGVCFYFPSSRPASTQICTYTTNIKPADVFWHHGGRTEYLSKFWLCIS